MSSDLKKEYLDKKYAEYDDESDVMYKKRKHVHKTVKKSDHKHEYENVVVIDPTDKDSFNLVGRCKVCGKIGRPVKDNRIDRKFPNVQYTSWYVGILLGNEEEYGDFEKWCKEHYTVYKIENFDLWENKYI